MGLHPFNIVLKGVTGSEEEYLFLNVKVGNDQIIELHDKLYSGLLKTISQPYPYIHPTFNGWSA